MAAETTISPGDAESTTVGLRELRAVVRVGCLAATAGDRRERAQAAIHEIGELVNCDAIALSGWNPYRPEHEHLAAVGYPEHVVAYTNAACFVDDRVYRSLRSAGRPRRMVDVPGIEQSDPFVSVFGPAGYGEGVISPLRAADGRYTGMLYLSTRRDVPASEAAIDLLDLASAALAELADVTNSLQTVADTLAPILSELVVMAEGAIVPLPGRAPGRLLDEQCAIPAEAWRRAPREGGIISFLWFEDGELLRIHAARVASSRCLIVGATPTSSELTIRELEVLTVLATGATNPEIAGELFVSRHTVSRHIEHILEKLCVGTRAAAASVAVRDGLILGGRADRSSAG